MLRTGRPPRDRSEQMIVNNYLTMQRIGALKNEPLTREMIFDLHRIVTQDTLDDPAAAGRLRRANENIRVMDPYYGEVFHEPPAARELDGRLAAMIAFANAVDAGPFVHPVLRAITLHFWLAYDHPFVDGNGRTARALFYWSMLRSKYWLFEYVSISEIILRAPVRYARAFLYTETDDNDLTYFICYHLDVIQQAVGLLHAYIAKKTEEMRRLASSLRGMELLNHRQRALVEHAIRHPNFIYTVTSHRNSHMVVYETARRDLKRLSELGLLRAGKQGREAVFRPPADIEQRLARLRAR